MAMSKYTRIATAFLALLSGTSAVPSPKVLSQPPQNTALILIDTQNHFITGSNDSRAPSIVPKVLQLLDQHEWPLIVASQDWHPVHHISFASNHPDKTAGNTINISFVDTPKNTETQTLSANHCVPGTWGVEIEKSVQSRLYDLEGYRITVNYIKKAQDHSVDSYSAFADNQYHRFTTLDRELGIHGIETLVVTGLVTNTCVRGTCIDGVKLEYEVVLVEDATESTTAMGKLGALEELRGWGVQIMNLADWEAGNPTGVGRRVSRETLSWEMAGSGSEKCQCRACNEKVYKNTDYIRENYEAYYCFIDTLCIDNDLASSPVNIAVQME